VATIKNKCQKKEDAKFNMWTDFDLLENRIFWKVAFSNILNSKVIIAANVMVDSPLL